MADYATLAVSPKVAKTFEVGTPGDLTVLRVQPPKNGPGMDPSVNLIKSLHHVDVEESMMSKTVNSKLTSFEMWYQNEQLDFYFVVPDEEEEDHYRRQLSGYYKGVNIQEETLKENQFPNIEKGRSIAVTRLGATSHIFEPIWAVGSGGDDDTVEDPYQPILNEVDSKTNLSIMVQVLYKPVPSSWTRIAGTSLQEYSTRLEEEGILNERMFGRVKTRVNDSSLQSQGAEAIRQQAGQPAFRTEVRLAVAADSDRQAQLELDALVDLFENTYKGRTDQTLQPIGIDDAEDLVARMVARKFHGSGLPSGITGKSKVQAFGTTPTLICSAPELAGLVHLPSEETVPVSGVNYTKALVEGTLPPDAKRFKPVSKKEKQKVKRKQGKRKKKRAKKRKKGSKPGGSR